MGPYQEEEVRKYDERGAAVKALVGRTAEQADREIGEVEMFLDQLDDALARMNINIDSLANRLANVLPNNLMPGQETNQAEPITAPTKTRTGRRIRDAIDRLDDYNRAIGNIRNDLEN